MEINGHEETTGEEIDWACDTRDLEEMDRRIHEKAEERNPADIDMDKAFEEAAMDEDTRTLSDKIVSPDNNKKDNGFYWEKDVKQFIKDLKKIFCLSEEDDCNCSRCKAIRKLAGGNLV